jgi:hypothetical protein
MKPCRTATGTGRAVALAEVLLFAGTGVARAALFADDFESGLGAWNAVGGWTLSQERAFSGVNAWRGSGLALDTPYAYRVYAVPPCGTYSADGQEAPIRTANNPPPFADDSESGAPNWNFLGAWGVESNGAALTLPVMERFEAGLSNWAAGGWVTTANAPHEGAQCARCLVTTR